MQKSGSSRSPVAVSWQHAFRAVHPHVSYLDPSCNFVLLPAEPRVLVCRLELRCRVKRSDRGPTGAAKSSRLHLRDSLAHRNLSLEPCRQMECGIFWLPHENIHAVAPSCSEASCIAGWRAAAKGHQRQQRTVLAWQLCRSWGGLCTLRCRPTLQRWRLARSGRAAGWPWLCRSIGEGFACSWSDAWHTLGVWQSDRPQRRQPASHCCADPVRTFSLDACRGSLAQVLMVSRAQQGWEGNRPCYSWGEGACLGFM